MSVRLGINGFGRIGRLVLRASFENNKGIKVTAINDPFMDLDYMIYQLKYDSAHGLFKYHVEKGDKALIVEGHKIAISNEKDPSNIKWGDSGANIVCESTGVFLT
jgi:glyceraldehyde 3-phosphate dehydrogenase